MTAPANVVDVLVVGAGPAGAATAVTAARAGLHVLLADDSASHEAYDIVVSGVAAQRMTQLGVETQCLRPADLVELRFPRRSREVTGVGAAITDSGVLRAALSHAAIAAGAELVTGRVTLIPQLGGGNNAVLNGIPILATHIVLATGAAATTSAYATGIACAQRFENIDIPDRIVLAPIEPAAEPGAQPAMLTVLSGSDGGATVWLTRRGTARPTPPITDPSQLLADALAMLAVHDERFAAVCPIGSAVHATNNSGFSPDLLKSSDALLVGDAAGLANPFTGEGIGAALRSGMLAGQAIAAHVEDAQSARAQYIRHLASEYVGYFETARHATRRYHLVWRTLDAAAASDHTIFAKAR